MPYASASDVRAALAPTDSTAGSAAALTDAELDDAVTEAEGVVDAYLAPVHTVPITDTPVPKLVWGTTRDIAAYLATLRFRKTVDLPADDPTALRYAHAMGLLDKVAKGVILIEPEPGGTPESVQEVTVVNRYTGHLFEAGDFGLATSTGLPLRVTG